MASISGQAHGEHVTEFVYQDRGESDGYPIDGEPGIALIASDQKNGEPEKRMDPGLAEFQRRQNAVLLYA